MKTLVLLPLCIFFVFVGCQSPQTRKAQQDKVRAHHLIECRGAEQAKQVLYSVKGDISEFANIANCYNQIGKHGVAKLFYQKSLDQNKDLQQSILGLAKINDLDNLPLVAKSNYETLVNQLAVYGNGKTNAYWDYGLFSLYYRDVTASNIAAKKLKGSELVLLKAYQELVLGNDAKAMLLWKKVQWGQLNIDSYRAFHIAHLAKALDDKSVLKNMIKKFDLAIPETRRISIQKSI